MQVIRTLALIILTLAVVGATSFTASATSTFGPKDYRVYGPTGDLDHSVLLTMAIQTNAAWQQGNDEPVTITVDATRGAAVTQLEFHLLVPVLFAQVNGNWAIIDGNPTGMQSTDSHVSVTVPERSGYVLSEAWFQVELSMTLAFSNGSTHSISGWTTGRDFGPISVSATPFYGISDFVPSLTVLAALIVIPVAFVLYARHRRRGTGRSGARESESSRRGS